MSATELRPAFRQRFRAVTRQIWSLHVGRGLARTAVVAVLLLAAVAAVDYLYELPWLARAGLAVGCLAVVVTLFSRWVVRPAREWGRVRVAAELEGLFPRLGQRLRTTLQHGGRPADELAREGVAPSLVAALEEETAEKARPLPFQAALPVRPAVVAGVVSLACVAALAVAAARDSEFRTALQRVALAPVPYTTVSASPSADVVDEGADVEVRATVDGRARPAIVLHVREVGEPDWRQETMDPADGAYSGRLGRLRRTTEFFVAAGADRTPVQQVVVQRPLKITGTFVEVTSPAYTGVAPATYDNGSFSAVQGSTARLRFDLDRPPVSAALVVKDPSKPKAAPRRVEMAVQGNRVTAELQLAADVEYALEARDAAGVPAVANRNRVRVTADQPPTVWFDEPSESIEVHTLAEVLVRARARDDFGVSKVGVVFQVNNEEERTLVLQDVTQPFQREAQAEQALMLEQFLLTQKDCVAYYAFAEDNRPGTPQRATTELRFIDIRPFLRSYKLVDDPEAMPGPQRELIFLDEVIARQRFNLNQTMRLETRSKAHVDVAQVDRVAAFENKLATQTHDLADFLAGLGIDGAALLSQAEETMLSAVDSIQGAKFTNAIGQERDALRYLMEARNTVQQALRKESRAVRAQARAFDRLQRQKLRRQNEKAETLPEIAAELARLADEEDDVARALSVPANNPGTGGSGEATDPMTNPGKPEKPEKPDGDKPKGDKPDPKGDKPDGDKPNGDKPDADKPGGKSGDGKPDPEKKGGQPDANKPDPEKKGDQPDANKPDADKPGSDKPDADKPMGDERRPGKQAAGKNDKSAEDPAQERQDDIAARATALDKVAATAKGLTGLAKTRITDAAKAANAAADALGQRDRQAARKEADRARELFRTTAKQVAALAAEEAAQQIAAARDLANDVAQQAAPSDQKQPGAGQGEENKMPGLGSAAEQAKSVKDVLEQVAGSGSEASADAARKVAGLLKQEDLAAAIERLQKPGAAGDRAERQDLADRFAALGQKLDQAYRETIAPRLEELAKLEREANELEQKAAGADDAADLRRLRQQVGEFVERLEAAKIAGVDGDELRDAMRSGLTVGGSDNFGRGLAVIHARLVAKLQEFIAGDRVASGSEAVPPAYRDLVDRYLRALSAGNSK